MDVDVGKPDVSNDIIGSYQKSYLIDNRSRSPLSIRSWRWHVLIHVQLTLPPRPSAFRPTKSAAVRLYFSTNCSLSIPSFSIVHPHPNVSVIRFRASPQSGTTDSWRKSWEIRPFTIFLLLMWLLLLWLCFMICSVRRTELGKGTKGGGEAETCNMKDRKLRRTLCGVYSLKRRI